MKRQGISFKLSASVTEIQVTDDGLAVSYIVGENLTLGEREGFVKVVADQDNTIIGGQILGVNASEMISELTLAIALKAKANDLADMLHPHPSLGEAIWEACGDLLGRAIHKL